MVGDGPDRVEAETEARDLGLNDKVFFLGKIDAVAPLLAGADLFLLPSSSESFGLSALEALACGVPVVVTEDTGAKELVANGVNGEIVPTDDPDALRSVLERRLVAHRSVARPSRDQLVNF
jgi:glycosyltransferase involved in cell wall biosynthesis